MADHVTPRFRKGDVVLVEATVEYYRPGFDTVELRVAGELSPSFYVKIDQLPKEPARSVFEVGDEVYRDGSLAIGKVAAIVDDWLIVAGWAEGTPRVWLRDCCRRAPGDQPEAQSAVEAAEPPQVEPLDDVMPDALDEAGI